MTRARTPGASPPGLTTSRLVSRLGMRVTRLADGEAAVSMAIDQRLDNWRSRPHGGAIMALANRALQAVASAMPSSPTLSHFEINFLAAPNNGDDVTASARLIHVTSRLAMFGFEVRDGQDRLLARGHALGWYRGQG